MTPAKDVKATAETPAWTDMQDALLIGLKRLNKTWKEIGVLVEGKDTEDLRERYTELMAVKGEGKKAEAVVEPVKASDATGKETEDNQQKSKKFNKKANKQNEKKGDKGKTSDQKEQGEETPGNAKSHKPGKDAVGVSKPDGDGEQQVHQGQAIIYVDPKDGFSSREVSFARFPLAPKNSCIYTDTFSQQLSFLSKTHQRLEQDKWLQLSSKLYDKTGIQIDPDLLKQKFKNMTML